MLHLPETSTIYCHSPLLCLLIYLSLKSYLDQLLTYIKLALYSSSLFVAIHWDDLKKAHCVAPCKKMNVSFYNVCQINYPVFFLFLRARTEEGKISVYIYRSKRFSLSRNKLDMKTTTYKLITVMTTINLFVVSCSRLAIYN